MQIIRITDITAATNVDHNKKKSCAMIGNWILTTMLLPTSQNVDFQKQVSEIRVMQK